MKSKKKPQIAAKSMGNAASEVAILHVDGKQVQLPILKGTAGNRVIDISELAKETGYFTFDPGFKSTASCCSAITFIDGDKGVLQHRGYGIEYLTQKHTFEEVCHLLFYGNMPKSRSAAQAFHLRLIGNSLVNEQLQMLFFGFNRSSHPMAIMVGAVGSMSAFYHDDLDLRNVEQRDDACLKILSKVSTLAAMAYKYICGHKFIPPKLGLSYSDNLLHMMFSTELEEYKILPSVSKAFNQILILHADHEQNASTSTVRLAGSSGANPFAVISAGIASLWGPSHGGANEAVLKMLEEIGTVDNIPLFIKRAKDKNDPFRLMGFGHRVYRNYDPRATVLKKSCDEVLKSLKINNPLLAIAKELERIALKDEYFVSRKLFPNVDFYSGIIYAALGIPPKMFTVIFAVARTAGWISQWKEMMEDPQTKIGRPRQLYIGKV